MDTENPRAAGDRLLPRPQVLREGSGLGFWTAEEGPPGGTGQEAAGVSHSPCVSSSNRLSCALGITEQRRVAAAKAVQAPEAKREGPGDAQDQRHSVGLGWARAQGSGVGWSGLGQTQPPLCPEDHPVYLGAGQEIYWLPLPPPQTTGRGDREGIGLGQRKDPPPQNFLQLGQCPGEG